MGRSEARINVDIWAPGSDFLTLSTGAQRMYFFLLSQPDLAHDGVLALRERRWSKTAAGLTVDEVSTNLKELEASRYVLVDEDTEELLVRTFLRGDKVYRQPNVLRAAADHLPLVISPRIREALRGELLRVQELDMPDGSRPIITAMLEAIPEPSDMPTGNPSANPSDMPTPGTPGERGVVTDLGIDIPVPPSPSSPESPIPAKPSPPASAAQERGKRGTRIPDPFVVTPEMVAWAKERVPNVDGRLATEKFINYWTGKSGKDATKVSWPATWRNWMLEEQQRAGTTGRFASSRASPGAGSSYVNPANREDAYTEDV